MVELNLKLSVSSMGRAQFASERLLQVAALARSRRGRSRIALAALAIISPARRPNAATSTGAGGLHERPRSSFSCRRSGAFCVCGFRMAKRSFTTHVPIPDRSIPFPHRHARRVSNFIQITAWPRLKRQRQSSRRVGKPGRRGRSWKRCRRVGSAEVPRPANNCAPVAPCLLTLTDHPGFDLVAIFIRMGDRDDGCRS
jgi:hypothetical protein